MDGEKCACTNKSKYFVPIDPLSTTKIQNILFMYKIQGVSEYF